MTTGWDRTLFIHIHYIYMLMYSSHIYFFFTVSLSLVKIYDLRFVYYAKYLYRERMMIICIRKGHYNDTYKYIITYVMETIIKHKTYTPKTQCKLF